MNEIEKQFKEAFLTYLTEENQIEIQNSDGSKKCSVTTKVSEVTLFEESKCFEIKIKDNQWNLPEEENLAFISWSQRKENAIDGYNPDFIVGAFNALFAIEIDGHEWHEKTKEQAAADKRRERALLKRSYIPIRFTGTEIYHTPIQCIKEIIEIIAAMEYEAMLKLNQEEK